MAETKPGIFFNEDGVCQACVHNENRKETDWEKRQNILKEICYQYKRSNGRNDCILTGSGGKDTHFQLSIIKEEMGMNPLICCVSDWFTHTGAGQHNFMNMCDAFDCDIWTFQQSAATSRKMVRISFEEFGSPTWPIDQAIYVQPLRLAIALDIPLVIYGENVSYEYGGIQNEETYSAKDQINNDVAKAVDWDLWYKNGITESQLTNLQYPSQEEIDKLEIIYLSYFYPWDGYKNYQIAQKYGFWDLKGEWSREGYIEDYDQIDSIGYLMNVYLKYLKHGWGRATDVVGYQIRSGLIDKEEGMKLIEEHDHKLDPRILEDFLQFTGYSEAEFWQIAKRHARPDVKIGPK